MGGYKSINVMYVMTFIEHCYAQDPTEVIPDTLLKQTAPEGSKYKTASEIFGNSMCGWIAGGEIQGCYGNV